MGLLAFVYLLWAALSSPDCDYFSSSYRSGGCVDREFYLVYATIMFFATAVLFSVLYGIAYGLSLLEQIRNALEDLALNDDEE